MKAPVKLTQEITDEQTLIALRTTIRDQADAIGFSRLEQTKLITAASELARNMLLYANGGKIHLEPQVLKNRKGLKLTFEDEGPGIKDVEQALETGYSSGTGLGLGLPGARKLVNEFDIKSQPGHGTVITIILWKYEP